MKLTNWLQKLLTVNKPQQILEKEKILKSDEVFLDTIESLKETIRVQNETITQLAVRPQPIVEKQVEYVTNPVDEELKLKVQQLNEERILLREQLNSLPNPNDINRYKDAYKSLLVFTFENLNPQTNFDPSHAKKYWEDLIK